MNARRLPWALPLLLLFALPARAGSPGKHELSLSAGGVAYASYNRVSPLFNGYELAYHRPAGTEGPWRSLRVGGGLRIATPMLRGLVPLEGFVQALLTARIGVWEPSMGPELGVSGLARLQVPITRYSAELDARENARLTPLYVGFAAAPLRFRFGSFVASALELQLGTSAPSFGTAARLHLGLLRVGYAL